MRYICEKKCYFRDRLWTPGSVLDVEDEIKVPRFFRAVGPSPSMAPETPGEPRTFKELQDKEAKDVLQPVKATDASFLD